MSPERSREQARLLHAFGEHDPVFSPGRIDERAASATDRERIRYLYESLLGRLPGKEDLAAAENLLGSIAEQADLEKLPLAHWQSLCHTMLMSSEFLYTR